MGTDYCYLTLAGLCAEAWGQELHWEPIITGIYWRGQGTETSQYLNLYGSEGQGLGIIDPTIPIEPDKIITISRLRIEFIPYKKLPLGAALMGRKNSAGLPTQRKFPAFRIIADIRTNWGDPNSNTWFDAGNSERTDWIVMEQNEMAREIDVKWQGWKATERTDLLRLRLEVQGETERDPILNGSISLKTTNNPLAWNIRHNIYSTIAAENPSLVKGVAWFLYGILGAFAILLLVVVILVIKAR